MRINFPKIIISLFFIFLIIIIFTNTDIVRDTIILSFDLWAKRVFPALFPMFVISDVLIKFGDANVMGRIFSSFFKKLFKTSGLSAYVMIMSLLSGTPSNAIFIRDLYDSSYLTINDANKILSFSFFPSPIFLYTFLYLIFNDYTIALKIIVICYLGNIIIGILFRNYNQSEYTSGIIPETTSETFSGILTSSIKKSMSTLIMILGTITFFILIANLINETFDLNMVVNSIFKGGLELTSGLNSMINLNIGVKLKAMMAATFISFGGLSIHMQIKSVINDTPISYNRFLVARIIHTIISIVLILFFF